MASITFYLDYAPYLTKIRPKAFIVYCFYDKLKDDKGSVQLTYKEVMDQIGISSSCMADAMEILIELGLIKKIEDASERFRRIAYEVVDPPPLTPERRKELFDKCGFSAETKIRAKYDGRDVPKEYLQLLDVEKMKKAHDELGDTKFNITKQLAEHFKLDVRTFGVFLETDFRNKVNDVKRQIKNQVTENESPSIKEEIVKEIIVPKEKDEFDELNSKVEVKKVVKDKAVKRTTAELYKLLIDEGHLERKTKKEIPINEWKGPQILRYFCVCYKQRYGVDYSFTGNPFSSKEIRDMASILGALSDPVEVRKYFDWAFNVKDKDLKGGISSTGIVAHGRMINEFNKRVKPTTTSFSTDFVDWIKQNESSFLKVNECKTLDDLKVAQEAVRTGSKNESVIRVVKEAIKRGILNE